MSTFCGTISSDEDAGETSGQGGFAESESREERKLATSSSEKLSWRSWTVSPTGLVDLESGAIIDVFVEVVVVVVVFVLGIMEYTHKKNEGLRLLL
jgi:hypothetical protein